MGSSGVGKWPRLMRGKQDTSTKNLLLYNKSKLYVELLACLIEFLSAIFSFLHNACQSRRCVCYCVQIGVFSESKEQQYAVGRP